MNKGIICLIVAVIFVGVLFFLANPMPSGYFDDGAEVMYFYHDGCGVCNYIKPALEQLGNEGYKIRGINVYSDQIPEGIEITGTPTFVAPDGEMVEGIKQGETVDQFKLRLQTFLDKY